MQLSTIDIVVILVYAVGIFGLAQWVSRDKSGHEKDTSDYFLASKSLPWWAIGASLIAANISAEQIVGMAGSGYAVGLAIASYEWMGALTLLIVGKFFLPIFLRNEIYTMPQFLEQRYGDGIRTLMAIFWLALYIFVNLTSILWLGSIAVTQIAGIDQTLALIVLGLFALLYQLRGGLKAVALTDIVQVTLLVLGGLTVSALTLSEIGGDAGIVGGFAELTRRAPEKFDMILSPDNPFYSDLPGISVLVGGMWIANLSYWGFNQYIIQRALAAKDLPEAQKGIVFASFLKLLMPLVIVLPGIAAVLLAPDLDRPDAAFPTMMRLLPPGLLGLVFAALIAAIIASMASKINSIATIFTLDLYAKYRGKQTEAEDDTGKKSDERHLVFVGRITACVSILIGIIAAKPLLGGADQAFQFIQEFSGFFTPGITVIFMLGLFWKRASEAGAITAAIASVVLSFLMWFDWSGTLPALVPLNAVPFMDRMLIVFFISLGLAVMASLMRPAGAEANRIETAGVTYATSRSFNLASLGVILVLIALYATWW
ncbi:sodium/sugar symporter [Pacificimonas flava]|uniref:Sodium-dependent galactose transporter n=1 Tax=Pacificimonas flava TaxID=1234595 RepID=M2U4B5_9SPHN|nr:sodium/sugar symporter [Pacificimonas flava]EMD82847.1 sodium-dependent galactose transporter [Pacificimonas flava]MBB5279462.1 SSS family solute:Na+ symporter [Pacificimonas flava]